ncbi:SdiA-regulated domain-containing protein [Paraflavisolibacter sp. H34]|uniref:SdiA-regulated domain-containing protein n=1 Tax=Huijunlia imazamoxiresistens TaxID=3127457 RepID=UPI003017BBCD
MRKIFQTQCPASRIWWAGLCGLLLACSNSHRSSPEGYNLRKPVKRELGKDLNEISGIAFSPTLQSLLSISDSKRKVVRIDLQRQKLKNHVEKFYHQSDFEDIVLVDSLVYVLISDGTILSMPLSARDSTQTVAYPFWSKDKNDFETLYYDPSEQALVMLCKDCAAEKGQHVRTAYRFDLARKQFDSSAFYTISTAEVKALLKKDDADFRPSAAAIHPLDGRLYILSSAGQLLVVTDTRGKVLAAYPLNPDLFPQAEGLAFSPSGTMFITNEGKYGKANLLVFPYYKRPRAPKGVQKPAPSE